MTDRELPPLPQADCAATENMRYHSAQLIRAYGRLCADAEWNAAIEAAAKVLIDNCHDDMLREEEAAAIRRLKR